MNKVLSTTKWVGLINKKEFVKLVLNENSKTFVVYVAFFNLASKIYSNRKAQIGSLLKEEVKIPNKYSDFTNIFSKKKALVIPECIKLNELVINLEHGKQLTYGSIYSLGPMEIELLKTYIEIYLKTGFI